jgi:flagellar hook-associated protein 3 FlgL
MFTRVATFSLQSSMLDASMRILSRMAEKELQSASGLQSETYSGLNAASTTRVLNLQSALSKSQTLTDSLAIAGDRVETMYGAIGDMIDQLTNIRSILSASSTETGSEDQLNNTAQGTLDDLEQLLNTKYDGRYLFGGAVTTSTPVDLSAMTTPTIPSTVDDSYYNGTDDLASVRLGSDQTLEYGVTANDQAVEKAIRAVMIAATMSTDPVDSDALNEAYDLATTAIEGLTALQATLSLGADRIETAQYREESLQLTLTNSITDLTQVDVAAVTVELKTYETQLQASYSALATIFDTSLADYL